LSHTSNPFCSGYFEDGIFKLFVQTGLELWSSWPQAPKEVGIQVWAISHQHPALLFFIPTWARYLKFFFYFAFIFVFWGKVSQCSPGWLQTLDPSASVSQLLGKNFFKKT
jgi:hypothetical protein